MADSLTMLKDATQLTANFNEMLREWIEGKAPAAPLNDVLKTYFLTDQAYDALDEQRKITHALLESLSRKVIPDQMQAADTKAVTIDSIGRRFNLSSRMSASLVDKEKGMTWLREHGHGDLIQPTVNSSSLAAFAKDYIKTNGTDLPEDTFKVSTMTVTSVTKV